MVKRNYHNEALENFNSAAKDLVYPLSSDRWVRVTAAKEMLEQYCRLAEIDEVGLWSYPHNFPISKAKALSTGCEYLVIYIPFSIINLTTVK